MKIFVDLASIAKRALLAGKDTENGIYEYDENQQKEILINSAQYGYDNLANSVATTMRTLGINPKDMVLVDEGVGGTTKRKGALPGYKAGSISTPRFYKQYNEMLHTFKRDMLNLGAQTARFDGVEADDLIGWFCKTITEDQILVWTNDHDLLILGQHPNVNVYSNGEVNPKPYGDFPYEFVDVYKATVGDSSDKIPGAKGFGPKAFEAVYTKYGDNGLRVLRKLIQTRNLAKLQEDVAEVPQLQKLIDYAPDVETSLKVATLATGAITLEKILWEHGMNSGAAVHPLLHEWRQRVVGVTADNFDAAFFELRQMVENTDSVCLDIETSTPQQSDDWLFSIKGEESSSVDVFGSELTGLALTVGSNAHRTFYFSVDHADTSNCSLEQVESVLKFLDPTHRFIIQNVNFELVVLYNTFGWFLRDVDDTKLMASYVDENGKLGLKQNSERWLGYKQASYNDTVKDSDGRLRRMNELALSEVLSYGSDDTICTAALYSWFQLHMMLENVWQVYRDVEIGAAYWVAQAFIDGVKIDREALAIMTARDAKAKLVEEATLHEHLIQSGWDGAVYIPADAESWSTPNWVKYAFHLVTGSELKTAVRKLERLAGEVRAQGSEVLADLLMEGDLSKLNRFVQPHFQAAPSFNINSPKQMRKLLYEEMGLPIRLRNKQTDLMRLKGVKGSPQTDDVAINSALHYDMVGDDPRKEILEALLKIKTYSTRESLYYKTYPHLPHWKDQRIHASNNQCAAVTRRFTCSSPNLAQLSKSAGDFRTIFIPHNRKSMIVSLDFSAQELRLIADYSQDENMLACFVGDDPKDMHSLTAAGIAKLPYAEFKQMVDDEAHPKHKWAKGIRALGKTTNFATEYGAAAPKMAQTLMVTEEEAQAYINAKAAAFPQAEKWKQDVVKDVHVKGYATTMLGARRHLPDLKSGNKWEIAKAERQAGNFKIQGSGAEMTKLAMGRMWFAGLRQKYDIRFFSPIHDEVVFSIAIEDMPQAIPEIHAAMTAQYAQMSVPVESSVSFGLNFGDQHEMGDVAITPEEVQRQLSEFLKAQEAA